MRRSLTTYVTALIVAGMYALTHAQIAVETQDGLELALDADGRVVELRLDGGNRRVGSSWRT